MNVGSVGVSDSRTPTGKLLHDYMTDLVTLDCCICYAA